MLFARAVGRVGGWGRGGALNVNVCGSTAAYVLPDASTRQWRNILTCASASAPARTRACVCWYKCVSKCVVTAKRTRSVHVRGTHTHHTTKQPSYGGSENHDLVRGRCRCRHRLRLRSIPNYAYTCWLNMQWKERTFCSTRGYPTILRPYNTIVMKWPFDWRKHDATRR